MIGLGTIINTVAVLAGGLLGLLLKNGIAKKFESILMQSLGLATIFIGAAGVLKYMLVLENGTFTTRGTMLLIFSLVIGCMIGQWLDIESKMETIGIKLKAAARVKNDNRFVEGFVTTSLIICVGAMAIVGAMEDGLPVTIPCWLPKHCWTLHWLPSWPPPTASVWFFPPFPSLCTRVPLP